MVTKMIKVFGPTSKKRFKGPEMAERPTSLEDKVMGIVWNDKPGGDVLLNRFGDLLEERFHLKQTLKLHHQLGASIAENRLNEFAERCDFVIVGVGN